MPAREYQLNLQSNATTRLSFTLRHGRAKTPAEMAKLPTFDLTGVRLHLQVRKTETAADVLLDCSTENGRLEIAGDGKFSLVLHPGDLQTVKAWRGTYDLLLILPPERGGDHIPLLFGEAICKLGVTRR